MIIRTILQKTGLGILLTTTLLAQGISDSAKQQIAEILQIKRGFSPALQKMDSDTAIRTLKAAGRLPAWMSSMVSSNARTSRVEIRGAITPALQAYLTSVGATLEPAGGFNDVVVALVPLSEMEAVGARPEVRHIAAPSLFTTNSSARLKVPPLMVGALTSQGYISHRTNQEIASLGYTGAGVKVGVLSDTASPARVAALIASGDLPANTVVLAGQDGGAGTDEGTAMMEIVSDMAPGAQLYFATAGGGQGQFAANILALAAAGCKVIVDDVSYFAEPVFQDGPIAQAVNTVTAAGVVYISSAGNDGNLTRGTSGVWEGDFVDGGPVSGPVGAFEGSGNFHSFGSQLYDTILSSSGIFSLKWSDPLGGSANDYDLFLLDSTGTAIKFASFGTQNGTQDPVEIFGTSAVAGDRLVVVLLSGVPRALHLGTHRGRLAIATSGAVYGHNGAQNAISAAAVFWNSARTGTKPFVGGAANSNETFSTDGPRRVFFQPNGTPITIGNVLFSTNGGTVLNKPDVAAADGVSTKTPGFNPFYGTSAAAPHLAGISALIFQLKPAYTAAQVKAAIFNSALDSMAPGVDRDSGYGIAMALAAVQYALAH